ncbi:MAG: class II fumarate hydratase [Tissierellia bacterium]|nr:class II fumarate hydratase [Tissierellia bacterium]
MNYRLEKDSMGEIKVPEDQLWGAQTQRSFENFKIGSEKMPLEVVHQLAKIKKAAAMANKDLGLISMEKKELMIKALDEIIEGKRNGEFPLSVWQTGSGTQTNMNVNEVTAHIAKEISENPRIHPNDDVNKSQSSNDVFPSAIHMTAVELTKKVLLPALENMIHSLEKKEREFSSIVKVGRTHLQDATPITLGQEFSGYRYTLERNYEIIERALEFMYDLPLGGTAVGTGLNTKEGYDQLVIEYLRKITDLPYKLSKNKFHHLQTKTEFTHLSGTLSLLAGDLYKIANDIRLLASGPRCGIGELILPSNEPGSSIMPGKVNPTQSEALTMVCTQVFGNHRTISDGATRGQFELNVFMPVMIFNFIQMIDLLATGMDSFRKNCIDGIKANEGKIAEYLKDSLMNVTALNPIIGYENSAKIAAYAYEHQLDLKTAAITLNILTEEEFDKAMDFSSMVQANIK